MSLLPVALASLNRCAVKDRTASERLTTKAAGAPAPRALKGPGLRLLTSDPQRSRRMIGKHMLHHLPGVLVVEHHGLGGSASRSSAARSNHVRLCRGVLPGRFAFITAQPGSRALRSQRRRSNSRTRRQATLQYWRGRPINRRSTGPLHVTQAFSTSLPSLKRDNMRAA